MKIAVVCANPWEALLPSVCQGNVRAFYQWLCKQTSWFCRGVENEEKIETYGKPLVPEKKADFPEKEEHLRIVYLQSQRPEVLKPVLDEADLVIVGMPGSRTECDKIYLLVLPWKEKCVFLWEEGMVRGEAFVRKIQNEYKLNADQIGKFKGLPSV